MTRIENVNLLPVRVSSKTLWRHLVLTCDDGRTGIGEYTLERAATDFDDLALRLGETLMGSDVDGLNLDDMRPAQGAGFEAWAVFSALDQAVCDLRAQLRATPLARWLNPAASLDPVALYANINRGIVDRHPDGFAAAAEQALAAGYDAIKIAPFDGVGADTCETPAGEDLIRQGLDRIRATANAIAGRAELQVDCHWRFNTRRAIALINDMAANNVSWFECPIAETADAVPDLRHLRALCETKGMRLAGCEMMGGLEGFAPYLRGEAYDVIMPDVKYAGGLREILRIAAAANERSIATSIHNPSGPIAHIFSVHTMAAMGSSERLEIQFAESPMFGEITVPTPRLANGAAGLDNASGLGAKLLETLGGPSR